MAKKKIPAIPYCSPRGTATAQKSPEVLEGIWRDGSVEVTSVGSYQGKTLEVRSRAGHPEDEDMVVFQIDINDRSYEYGPYKGRPMAIMAKKPDYKPKPVEHKTWGSYR